MSPCWGGGLTGLSAGYFIRQASPQKSVAVLEARGCGNGAVQVFSSAQDAAAAKEYVQQARSLGMPVEFWDASQVAGALGTEVYEAGFFDPNGGQIHPMKLERSAGVCGRRCRAPPSRGHRLKRLLDTIRRRVKCSGR
jgi:glycine/D-amino acid oxidase-like deaminating enzyme